MIDYMTIYAYTAPTRFKFGIIVSNCKNIYVILFSLISSHNFRFSMLPSRTSAQWGSTCDSSLRNIFIIFNYL